MTIPQSQAKEDAAIRELIDGFVKAICARDIDGVMRVFSSEVVSFDLGPPLQHGGGDGFRKRWQELFDSYGTLVGYEVRDLHIVSGDAVAFSRSLNRIKGTMQDGRKSDRWLRWTVGYRKTSGGWRIVHEHVSAPIDLRKGTALLNLKP